MYRFVQVIKNAKGLKAGIKLKLFIVWGLIKHNSRFTDVIL